MVIKSRHISIHSPVIYNIYLSKHKIDTLATNMYDYKYIKRMTGL